MYSQNAEEQHILNYFGNFVGSFISVGENDGTTFSNVRALALNGWRGVCVEPSPKAFERLKKLYEGSENIYCYPYAIGDHNGKAIMHESSALCSINDIALVSTFDRKETERWKPHIVPGTRQGVSFEDVEVQMFRWKTFVNRLKIKTFNFVSIDCEGFDLEILKQMDLTGVKCICLEWNGKPELKSEFEKPLEGFKIIYTSGENLIFAR